MPLSPGEQLGPYEILSPLGAGGMGEVYRARDPRVDREVAIKLSAEQFTERFDREVRAVAALNHPNICTLYDVGPNYLVMELVEGEPPRGPLPEETALKYARQIGAALEAAHDRSIVHRDLKPGNIKIKPDGTVKVLDFGLAKVGDAPPEQTEDSPTLSMAATRAGVILGTAGYMSPEQARGQRVDKRADIWAFGVVLYEMLTGRKPFAGEDLTGTLAKVIEATPDWDIVPASCRRLVKKCLEKDPRRRLRDIGDAWDLLEPASPPVAVAQNRWLWPALAGALALIAGIALWAPWRATAPPEKPLARLDVDLGADFSLPGSGSVTSDAILSPDGTRLAYVGSNSGGQSKLFTRRLDQAKATELPGTDAAQGPVFSPDGQWIAFRSVTKINKISVEGGAIVPLMDSPNFAGASWVEDGNIIVSEALSRGLLRVPAGGGSPSVVTELTPGEIAHAYPQVLPGGKAVLFVAYASLDPEKTTIEVFTFADRKRKVVARGGVSARYLPTSDHSGHLLYANKATVFAVPFDLDRLETRGTPVPVLDDVAYAAGTTGAAQFEFSRSGALLYRKSGGTISGMVTIQWVDSAGKREPMRNQPGLYQNPRLSPDGRRIALRVNQPPTPDIWIYDPQRDATTRLTFGGAIYDAPLWSPDGRFVVFASISNGLFWTRADGAGQPQPLLQSKTVQIPSSFSPDGKRLTYFEIAGAPQLWTVPIAEEGGQLKAGKPEQFLKTQFGDTGGSFSPDGKWLAYQSNESGRAEIYVRAFPSTASGGGKWQISNSGGTQPTWIKNGHELLYRSGDQLMASSYSVKGDTFVAEKPRVWIAKLGGAQFDLTPDGKRAAVLTPVETAQAPRQDHNVVMLQNFFDYLRQRVPLGK